MPLSVKTIAWTLVLFSVMVPPAAGQCTCMGGAAVSGGVPNLNAGVMGVLSGHELQFAASYRYGFGDTYLRGTEIAEIGPVLYYRMHYLDLSSAYGLTDALTLDAGIGVFPQKTQRFPEYYVKGNGIAHIILGARYLLAGRREDGMEWTVGAHGRIPVDRPSANLPQHLNPSTGAYGGSLHTLIALPVLDGTTLLCSQTVDVHGENTSEYQYGSAFTTTIGGLWTLAESLMLLFEFRGVYRSRDQLYDEPLDDTGSVVLSIVPQVGVQLGSLTVAPFVDYPVKRNYRGHQLANDFSLGLNLIYR